MGRTCGKMGRKGIHTGFLLGSEKERDYYEHQDVGGRIILKLNSECRVLDWTDLA
jgi:hypothetical protein